MSFSQLKKIDFAQACWLILLTHQKSIENKTFDCAVAWLFDSEDMSKLQLDQSTTLIRNENGLLATFDSKIAPHIPQFAATPIDHVSLHAWSGNCEGADFQAWFGQKNSLESIWLWREANGWSTTTNFLPSPTGSDWFAYYDPTAKQVVAYTSSFDVETLVDKLDEFTFEELSKMVGNRNQETFLRRLEQLIEVGSFITIRDGGDATKPQLMSYTSAYGPSEYAQLELRGSPLYEVLEWWSAITISRQQGNGMYLIEGLREAHFHFLRRWLELNYN